MLNLYFSDEIEWNHGSSKYIAIVWLIFRWIFHEFKFLPVFFGRGGVIWSLSWEHWAWVTPWTGFQPMHTSHLFTQGAKFESPLHLLVVCFWEERENLKTLRNPKWWQHVKLNNMKLRIELGTLGAIFISEASCATLILKYWYFYTSYT